MKYSRRELKYSANDAVYLTRPRAAFVTLVYFLIVFVIAGIFGAISPSPLDPVTDSVSGVVGEFVENTFLSEEADLSVKEIISMFTDSSQPAIWEQILIDLFDEYDVNPLDEGAMTQLISAIASAGMFLSLLSWLIGLVSKLITAVVEYGYRSYTLSVFRHQPTSFRQLFCAFPRFGLIAGSWALVGIFSFLWSLIPAVAGSALLVVAALLLADSVALLPVAAVLVIAMIIAPIILTNRYALTPYVILEQPELGIFGCIKRSKELMKKRSWNLFFLNLSFIGWRILIALAYVVIPALGIAISAVCYSLSFASAGSIALLVTLFLAIVVPIPAALWLEGYHMTAQSGFYHFALTGNLKPTARDWAAAQAIEVAPIAEEPAAEEPVIEDSVVDEPIVDEPVVDEPSSEEVVVEETAFEEPVAEATVAEDPVTEETVVEKSVTEETVTENNDDDIFFEDLSLS